MKEIVLGLVSVGILSSGFSSQKGEVTYHQTIAPLIRSKCLPCHSNATRRAPFDFSTYQSVASRIELIRNQVLSQNMPPMWAYSDFGDFSHITKFSDEEAVLFQQWIQQKMPEGTASKGSKSESTTGTQLGKVGVQTITFAKGFVVKREGLPYWSVVTKELNPKGGEFDSFWLEPVNPTVIRYATIAIVPKDMKLPSETYGSMDLPAKYLVGVWAPGFREWSLPKGLVKKYGPNSKLVAQVHYRPTGKVESAGFDVKLVAATQSKTQEPTWITLEKKDLIIPAGKSEIAELTYAVTKDITVLSLLPEARFYAGRVQLQYTPEGGKPMTVFENMRWDPYWMGNYMFAKPIKLAKGGSLTARFFYNNDEFCRINEGKKPKPIKNGPTASDEVCRMHLLVRP